MEDLPKLRRRLKKRLIRLGYCTFISLIIGASALTANPISFLLILPLILYFLGASLRQTVRYRLFLAKYSGQLKTETVNFAFSFSRFLGQPNSGFRISLLLFVLIIITIVARSYA